jgi:hypothetical protein
VTDWLPRLVARVPVTVRQLQHDTTGQLYSAASALLVSDERTLDATLRQLNQFGYDLDRLQFVGRGAAGVLERGESPGAGPGRATFRQAPPPSQHEPC